MIVKSFELLENNFTKQDEFTEHFDKVIKNKRVKKDNGDDSQTDRNTELSSIRSDSEEEETKE